MHELLLHAPVPAWRHDQVLSILAGIAAMQPITMLEKHLVFKPSRPPSGTGKAGPHPGGQAGQMKALQGQMHGDLFYLKLVEEVRDERGAGSREQAIGEGDERENGDVVMGEDGASGVCCILHLCFEHRWLRLPQMQSPTNGTVNDDGSSPTSWTLQFRDLPDPNKGRPVTSRAMADIPIMSGDHLKFMAAMDYRYFSRVTETISSPLFPSSFRPTNSFPHLSILFWIRTVRVLTGN